MGVSAFEACPYNNVIKPSGSQCPEFLNLNGSWYLKPCHLGTRILGVLCNVCRFNDLAYIWPTRGVQQTMIRFHLLKKKQMCDPSSNLFYAFQCC